MIGQPRPSGWRQRGRSVICGRQNCRILSAVCPRRGDPRNRLHLFGRNHRRSCIRFIIGRCRWPREKICNRVDCAAFPMDLEFWRPSRLPQSLDLIWLAWLLAALLLKRRVWRSLSIRAFSNALTSSPQARLRFPPVFCSGRCPVPERSLPRQLAQRMSFRAPARFA